MGGYIFCILTTIYMLLGVLFYELRAFTHIDELFSILIAVTACVNMVLFKDKPRRPFTIWLAISLFYLIYSLRIESNIPVAVFNDFIMQSKPYLVLFGLLCIRPKLEQQHFKILQVISLISLLTLIFIYIYHPEDREVATHGVMLTGDALSAVAILLGALYYLCCDSENIINKCITILIMSCGILSPTSKFWGILICAIAIVLFVNKPLKFNIKTLLLGCTACVVIFILVRDEFIFYFVEDFEYNTRPMLYLKMWDIMADHIPFGSGFATYANHASMTWYSPIYTEYGLDMIWGLDEGNTEHFASDAYYPIFAQFGYAGIALFVLLFIYLFREIGRCYSVTNDIKPYKVALIIIAYILIQSTSNSLANERSVLAMGILAIALYSHKPTNSRIEQQ